MDIMILCLQRKGGEQMTTTIGERIYEIIKTKQISKTDFANTLNITQAYVSKMLHKNCIPSERLIMDICDKFDINIEWLRNGQGEMCRQRSKEENIAFFIGSVLRDPEDTFKKRYLSILASLDENEWAALESIYKLIKKKHELNLQSL